MLASAADEHGVQTSSYCTYQHDYDHPAKALTKNEVELKKKNGKVEDLIGWPHFL